MWKYLRWICWHSNLDWAGECHRSQKIVYIVMLLLAAAISLQKMPSGVHSRWFSSSFWEHLVPVACTLKLNVDVAADVTVTPIQQMAPDLVVTMLRMGRRSILPPTQSYGSCLRCLHHHQLEMYYSLRIVQRLQKLLDGIPACSWQFAIKGVGVSVLWGRETNNSMWSTCIWQHWGLILSKRGQTKYQSLTLGWCRCAVMNYFFNLRFWVSKLMEKLSLLLSLVSDGGLCAHTWVVQLTAVKRT